jgi:inorganic pyrophosphatase
LEPRKWVKFKAWKDVGEAVKIINYAMSLFKEKFT